MITLTRRKLHEFRVVARKALSLARGVGPPVSLAADSDGLRIRVCQPDSAAELHLPGEFAAERICLPHDFLDTVGGKNDAAVTLERREQQISVQWRDGAVPQLVQFEEPTLQDDFPVAPAVMVENPPELLQALKDACTVTDPVTVRYALSCLQLDAAQGRVAASDGCRILVQRGFTFPWEGALLLPARTVFGSPLLPRNEPVSIGRHEDRVSLRVGVWTFHFSLNTDGRFPRVDDCIPAETLATTTVDVTERDAKFLLDNIRRLPTSDEVYRPITLDLNGEVVVRARADSQQPATELALVNSTRSGESIRVSTNREYLAQALALGFRQLRFTTPEYPVCCRDAKRVYVWAPLGKDGALPPAENAHRIESTEGSAGEVLPVPQPSRSKVPTMSHSANNGNGKAVERKADASPTAADPGDRADSPIQQAEALRHSLKDALSKANELIRTLKQQKKKSRVVESTLASLRQLQNVDL